MYKFVVFDLEPKEVPWPKRDSDKDRSFILFG